jgi:hypothetical protein
VVVGCVMSQISIAFGQRLSMDPNLLVVRKHNPIELIVCFAEVFVEYAPQMRLFLPCEIFDLIVHDLSYSA